MNAAGGWITFSVRLVAEATGAAGVMLSTTLLRTLNKAMYDDPTVSAVGASLEYGSLAYTLGAVGTVSLMRVGQKEREGYVPFKVKRQREG